jgi:hypothetical protein
MILKWEQEEGVWAGCWVASLFTGWVRPPPGRAAGPALRTELSQPVTAHRTAAARQLLCVLSDSAVNPYGRIADG